MIPPAQETSCIRALRRLEDDDPFFRAEDWSLQGGGCFADPTLEPEVRTVLKDAETGYQLRSLLLEALTGAPVSEALHTDLACILFSQEFVYRERVQAMQALAKSKEIFTEHLLSNSPFDAFVKQLHEEAQRTREYLLKVSGQKTLLENDPLVKQSIDLREKLILPLLVIQQYTMEQLKSSDDPEEKEGYEKLLLKTLPSIINASRNSA